MSVKALLPPRDIQWFDPATGRPTDIFADWCASVDRRTLREPVDNNTAAANGDVLTFDGTAGKWEPA